MRAQHLMLAALGGAMLMGGLFGATTSTTIKPPVEPPWRHAGRSEAASSQPVDTAPQDSGPDKSNADRTPTWKRHLPQYQTADYAIPSYGAPPPLPKLEADRARGELVPPADAADTASPAADPAAPVNPPDLVAEGPG